MFKSHVKAYYLVIATETSASLNNKLLMPDLIFILDMAPATRIEDKNDDEDVDIVEIQVKNGDDKVHTFYLSYWLICVWVEFLAI